MSRFKPAFCATAADGRSLLAHSLLFLTIVPTNPLVRRRPASSCPWAAPLWQPALPTLQDQVSKSGDINASRSTQFEVKPASIAQATVISGRVVFTIADEVRNFDPTDLPRAINHTGPRPTASPTGTSRQVSPAPSAAVPSSRLRVYPPSSVPARPRTISS